MITIVTLISIERRNSRETVERMTTLITLPRYSQISSLYSLRLPAVSPADISAVSLGERSVSY